MTISTLPQTMFLPLAQVGGAKSRLYSSGVRYPHWPKNTRGHIALVYRPMVD